MAVPRSITYYGPKVNTLLNIKKFEAMSTRMSQNLPQNNLEQNLPDQMQWPGNLGTVPKKNDQKDYITVNEIIYKYQKLGHFQAKLNPLGYKRVQETDLSRSQSTLFEQEIENLKSHDDLLSTEYTLPDSTYISGKTQRLKLHEIIEKMESIYCEHIGAEFMHIPNEKELEFFRSYLENRGQELAEVEQKRAFTNILNATKFESFLAKKWPSEKRFGLEGAEAVIAALAQIIHDSHKLKVDSFVIGMAHRGRLNVLANICRKPLFQIFTTFHGLVPDESGKVGDVKYHLGSTVSYVDEATKKPVKIVLVANPSHLESVNAVALGKVKAEMVSKKDVKGETVLPILIHGDASLCGQGVCYECLGLSSYPDFYTGGTIHVVINNQVGFTTDPQHQRSSIYCTDIGHAMNIPILHVNADNPIAVIKCAKIAADYRSKFHRDIILDIVGYRRHGHNEGDEPEFTQPIMYRLIKKHPTVLTIFSKELEAKKVLSLETISEKISAYDKHCEDEYQKSLKETQILAQVWTDSDWPEISKKSSFLTGVSRDKLNKIRDKLSSPENNTLKQDTFDFKLAELLAIESLRDAGIQIRRLNQKDIPMSEYGVLGFELGYSPYHPNTISIHEFESGKLSNGAQVIFDNYIASGGEKWNLKTGLVVILPHEQFSSFGHPERFLINSKEEPVPGKTDQLTDCNWIVATCTTPANYFHILRRQLQLPFRKPLILFIEKVKSITSHFDEITDDTQFQRIITEKKKENVKRIILCSGMFYYDLIKCRDKNSLDESFVIARLEQLAPFPFDAVKEEMEKFNSVDDIVWVQEESKNFGFWEYVRPRFHALGYKNIKYIGRPSSSALGTNRKNRFEQDIGKVVKEVLNL